jgi:hypothetical protein
MEESPAYWAAMILHPGHKKKWVGRFLGERQAERAYRACRDLYLADYAGITVPAQASTPGTCQGSHLVAHDYYDPPEDHNHKDELAEYLAEPVWPVDNIQTWWRDHRERWPRLSKMAFELMSIPAMSTGCERLFSQGKLAIGTQRHSLSDESINILMCLQNWRQKKEN